MRYELAIFDLDGTILDTLDDLAASVNYALANNSLPERSRDEVRAFVGNGIRLLIERSVPNGTPADISEKVFADFKSYYKDHCCDLTKPYENTEKVIKALRENGVRTAVVSNKADFAVQEICREYFPDMFDFVIGEREGIRKKPAPDSVNEVLTALGIKSENAVYIGDSDVDIQTAKNSNMDCISVCYGFRDRDFLAENGAEVIAEDMTEVYKLIL